MTRIPASAPPVHRLFTRVARRTWRDLRDDEPLQANLTEWGITDQNILALKRARSASIYVSKDNSSERDTGADWEMWLLNRTATQALKFRVQAKILDTGSQRYLEINREGQLQRLINQAQRASAYPIYCFYNYWPAGNSPGRSNCKSYPDDDLNGCAFVPASFVLACAARRRRQLVSLYPRMLPWHCLVSCLPYARSGDLLQSAIGWMRAFWNTEDTELRVLDAVPDYVRTMLPRTVRRQRDIREPSAVQLVEQPRPPIRYVVAVLPPVA